MTICALPSSLAALSQRPIHAIRACPEQQVEVQNTVRAVLVQLTCKVVLLGGALQDSFLLRFMIFLNFAVYGIWDDLAAWEIVLGNVPMICLQFLDFFKYTESRSVNIVSVA